VIGADLFGYIALASFLVDQIVWTAFVASLLFLLLKLVSDGLDSLFRPTSRLSRALMSSVGFRRESLAQIGALLSGVLTLTLYAVAALLIMAPWGLQSHDMVGSIEQAFFGFKVGDVTISPWGLLVALSLFGLGATITRAVQNWLEKRYLPLTQIDQGLKASIRTSVGYIGFILSLLFAVAFIGLNLEKLALVVSALSVGIGLGLQGVVNNFVSGLILLWEGAIRVGDLVVIGNEQGFVRRISVRATEIETYDRATMIVPNGNMMTGVVKNFVRGDRIGRIKIPISVLWGSDPDRVRETLIEVAKSHEEVVGIPAPIVFFNNLSTASLDFELICFVENVERAARVKSDLHFTLFSRLAEAGIVLTGSTPAMNVSLPAIEPLLQRYLDERPESKN
ncbi:MAG TPA: mechanosensitive ion channel domain-containing protein, partial [Rhodoblastus sp.]|nr:mechanosensitive ion channel domain-containing protein [Rhodoblastus sp.]